MIIGTAGHIDHGKTSLVKALTGVDADRLKEEKARGITLDLGYAYTPLPNGDVLGFIDVPGHEKLVHNMLAGATGIDFVLLVIAADDGPMPQTREHLAILDLLGLNGGAVVLTKIDCVNATRVDDVQQEIAALLADTRLADCPVFPVSSASGEGIAALRAHLAQSATGTPPRDARGHFRLAVDRIFTLPGTGTVVTGTVFSGTVHCNDKLTLSPSGLQVRVRGIHAQNRRADCGHIGQRCALNLTGTQLEKQDIHRGDWILNTELHQPTQRLDARLHLLPAETKSLKHWSPVHFHLGALDVNARIALLQGDNLQPGTDMLVQIVCDKPLCAVHGDRFIVRDQSATRTLGGGMVLDVFPPERNRRKPQRIAILHALETLDAGAALTAALQSSNLGIDLERFARNWNLRPDELATLQSNLPVRRVANWASSTQCWDVLKQTILTRLAELHAQEIDILGPDRERLRRMTLPTLERPVFAALLDELLHAAHLAQSGPWLHLPGHQVRLSAHEERLWLNVRPMLLEHLFQPPRLRDIAHALSLEEDATRRLMQRVSRTGQTYRVAHDHYFTQEAVQALAAIVGELTQEQGAASAADFRDRIGTGRKLAIQILECFDRIGYTQRIGDTHRLRPGTTVFASHTAL